MPDTVELVRRDGVELVRTGSWALSSGRWDAAPADLAAAVAAQDCPAIRRPVLWIGHTDQRFTPRGGDGEPTVGWVENLRLADGGHTLIGDYVGVPAWLGQVMASAYPDRSVEGAYNRRCQLGHTHPFVLDGVALLGVTRPGVGTLASLQSLTDVRALYGLAASEALPDGEVRVSALIPATVAAAAEVHTGAMVALIPTAEDAERLAVEGGEPADELHVTLAYLGDAVDLSDATRQDIIDAVSSAINGMPRIDAEGFGLGLFNPPGSPQPDGKDRDSCTVLLMGGDLLDAVHTVVGEALTYANVGTPQQHAPWHAHATLLYADDLDRSRELAGRIGPVSFDRLRIAFAGQHIDIPLIGDPEPVDESGGDVAAADGDDNNLKRYWLAGPGLKKWATKAHPWTALYRQLRKHIGNERAKRVASEWFHEHFGYWPGDSRHRKTSASAPIADRAEQVAKAFHESYERQAPDHGYRTREASAKPWAAVPKNNRALMVATVRDLLERGVISANVNAAALRQFLAAHGGSTVPNPHPDLAERIRTAWNATADVRQYIVQVRASDVIVMDETDRSTRRVPVTVDGDRIAFGEPVAVALDYVSADTVAASVAVYASRDESRPNPDPEVPAGDPTDPAAPAPTEPAPTEPTNQPPAAEPEPAPSTDPKGEDPVSTLSTDVRSRLGLADDADDAAVVAALVELKSKADTAPTPEQVAASASEADDLRKEVQVLASQVQTMSQKLATTEAEKTATVKASVLDDAQRLGKFTPADREQWDKDYDEAPGPITRVLASIAPGTAVPVTAAGHAADGEPAPVDEVDQYADAWAAQLGINAEELTRG